MPEALDDDDLEGKPRKLSRARKIRMATIFALALVAASFLIYTRWVMKKSSLGGPCKYAFQCDKTAPKCMRANEDQDGMCSRPCDPPTDCAPDIRCMSIELEDRDERGMPLKGGYCFSQPFLDAQKPKGAARDAGPALDSWLEVPAVPGQVEAEVTLRWDKGATPGTPKSYVVKGSLVRNAGAPNDKKRAIADTSGLRTFAVDDDKKQFMASVMDPPQGEAKIDKTGKKDNVLGRDCEIWKIDDGKALREACIIQGAAFVDPTARGVTPWVRELTVRGAFPLRVIETDMQGHEVARMSVTRFDAHAVDASLFTIPKSYKNLAAH